jgi:hypothetical protein
MIITILGSCRQEYLRTLYEITDIQDNISFPHYTKEMLEVIKFCKYGTLKMYNFIYFYIKLYNIY